MPAPAPDGTMRATPVHRRTLYLGGSALLAGALALAVSLRGDPPASRERSAVAHGEVAAALEMPDPPPAPVQASAPRIEPDVETSPSRRLLEPRVRVLTGCLVDVDGTPIPEARIWIWPSPQRDGLGTSRGPTVELRTEVDGSFRAEGVAEGPLGATLEASFKRHGRLVLRRLQISDDHTTIVAGSPREIAGTVLDAETGKPIPSFTVDGYTGRRFCGNAPPNLRLRFEDPRGAFRLGGLEPDSNTLEFRARGYSSARMSPDGTSTPRASAFTIHLQRSDPLGSHSSPVRPSRR